MDTRQKQSIEMYVRVKSFLTTHPAPEGTSYGPAADGITDVVRRLTGHTASQAQGKRMSQAEQAKQAQLLRTLCEQHLRPIVAIAKATEDGHPGIERALRMPSAAWGVTRILADAQAIHDAAALYPPVFVENGRQPDFLEKLQAAIDAIPVSQEDRGKTLGLQVGSREAIDKQLQRGRKLIDVLDAVIKSAFAGDDSGVLREWKVARRVRSAPGGRPATDGTATDGTATANGTATETSNATSAAPSQPQAA